MRHNRVVSGVAISGSEKSGIARNPSSVEFNEKELPVPETIPKEVEALLERELVGDGSRVMLVREDGTVVDDNPTELGHESDSSPAALEATENGNPRSRSASLAGHLRDGISVDVNAPTLEEDPDCDEPDSPISFKPRRRSPAKETPENLSRPSSAASLNSYSAAIRPKTPIPVPTVRRRTSNYFSNAPNSTSVSPTTGKNYATRPRSGSASAQHYTPTAHHGILNRNNSMGSQGLIAPPPSNNTSMSARHLTKRRTQMNLSLTTASPYNTTSSTTFSQHYNGATVSPLLSPSIPSIRKRERATSHPDIFQLCQSWAELGPANDLVVIEASPQNGNA